jgi:hypothetical protein
MVLSRPPPAALARRRGGVVLTCLRAGSAQDRGEVFGHVLRYGRRVVGFDVQHLCRSLLGSDGQQRGCVGDAAQSQVVGAADDLRTAIRLRVAQDCSAVACLLLAISSPRL